jgi:hypothetical protein
LYSIDQNSLEPPFSVLVGLFLAFGLDAIGQQVLVKFNRLHEKFIIHPRALSIPIGAALISLILHPLVLLKLAHREVLIFFALFIIATGFINLLIFCKRTTYSARSILLAPKQWVKAKSFPELLLLIIFIEFFLLSLCAVSNADSLDYHIGAAISILNTGGLFYQPEWIHARLAGSQEVLNALGLSLGSEQFGSIIQFFAFLGIGEIIYSANASRKTRMNCLDFKASRYFLLAILSSPVFVFLITSSKPDLWGIFLTTSAYALLLRAFSGDYNNKEFTLVFIGITFLAFSAYIAKFKFILSATILCLALLYWAHQKRKLVKCIFIMVISFLVIIMPSLIFKSITYNATLLDAIISPLPGYIPGIDLWIKSASVAADINSRFPFPISILVPDKIGNLSGILGLGVFIVFSCKFYTFWKNSKEIVVVCGMFLVAILIFAPPSSRNLIEPLIWIAILTFSTGGFFPIFGSRLSACMVAFQASVTIAMSTAGVLMYFSSALSPESRKSVLETSANGYRLMKWVDSVAPYNAVILSQHRSIALIPRQSISLDWNSYLPNTLEAREFFINRLIERGVSHALLLEDPNKFTSLKDCFGPVVIGRDVNPFVTRNPFNSSQHGDAWLVKINVDMLPSCAIKR